MGEVRVQGGKSLSSETEVGGYGNQRSRWESELYGGQRWSGRKDEEE